jgi:hypothetical protein
MTHSDMLQTFTAISDSTARLNLPTFSDKIVRAELLAPTPNTQWSKRILSTMS